MSISNHIVGQGKRWEPSTNREFADALGFLSIAARNSMGIAEHVQDALQAAEMKGQADAFAKAQAAFERFCTRQTNAPKQRRA